MKDVTLILRFVVIGLIYVIIFRLIRIMLIDLKVSKKSEPSFDYALEVLEAPDLSGISKGSVFPIHIEASIGRKDENKIVLNDPFVSGKHALVFIKDDKLYIKNLKSTNGILLNGKRIKDLGELQKGDIFEIGRIIFKIIG